MNLVVFLQNGIFPILLHRLAGYRMVNALNCSQTICQNLLLILENNRFVRENDVRSCENWTEEHSNIHNLA